MDKFIIKQKHIEQNINDGASTSKTGSNDVPENTTYIEDKIIPSKIKKN